MPDRQPFRLFYPILAGATLRDRAIGCVGALLAITLTGLVSGVFLGGGPHIPLIVAPIGASAVLLFAVPASPLAQPWPVIGGNAISALVGVIVAHLVPDLVLASGLAVALAIAVMSLTRCLHPPGGAAALTAVIGGASVTSAGFWFPLVPVALNSVLIVGLAVAFHRLTKHTYPHVPPAAPTNRHATADRPAELRVGFTPDDVDAALATLGETFDIDRADLDRVLRQVEQQAFSRAHGALTCADIMSRSIVGIHASETTARALELLLAHNLRTLPVTDASDRLVGTIGLRELVGAGDGPVQGYVSTAVTTAPVEPAANLIAPLTDGRTHAVIVTAPDRTVLGIITQTDLLATLTRPGAA